MQLVLSGWRCIGKQWGEDKVPQTWDSGRALERNGRQPSSPLLLSASLHAD